MSIQVESGKLNFYVVSIRYGVMCPYRKRFYNKMVCLYKVSPDVSCGMEGKKGVHT